MAEVETKTVETLSTDATLEKEIAETKPPKGETAAPAVDKKEFDPRLVYKLKQTEIEREKALSRVQELEDEIASLPKGDEDVATLKKQLFTASKRVVEVEANAKKQALENAALKYANKHKVDIAKLAGLSSEAEIRAVAAELRLAEAEAEAATPGGIDFGWKGKTTSSSWEEIKKRVGENPNDPDALDAYSKEARKRGLLRI